jgi:hypothetical protein
MALRPVSGDAVHCRPWDRQVKGQRHNKARRPGSFPASGHQVQSEQVHDPIGKALLAQHDVQLAASGDPLQDFQFPEPQSNPISIPTQPLSAIAFATCAQNAALQMRCKRAALSGCPESSAFGSKDFRRR